MQNSQSYKMCDYVTLVMDADSKHLTDHTYQWAINDGYYSNRDSSVCSVELVGGSVRTSANLEGLLCAYEGNARNMQTLSATGLQHTVIGYGDVQAATTAPGDNFIFGSTSSYPVLVPARPSFIKLRFLKASDAAIKKMAHGVITLKFSYYNSVETTESLHNYFTPTLK